VRTLLIIVGLLSLVLALIGIVLPLLPTTPFLLLSAGCFSRASTRLHRWMLRLPLVGAALDDYERLGGLSRRHKRNALLLAWSGIGASAMALAGSPALTVFLLAVAFAVSVIIVRLPAAREALGAESTID
jgi:uncharacterized membrane protein YbaN (DUF454 family)